MAASSASNVQNVNANGNEDISDATKQAAENKKEEANVFFKGQYANIWFVVKTWIISLFSPILEYCVDGYN